MMMERAKTAPAPEPTPSVEHEKPAASAPTSAEERVQDLERRLNLLDSGDGDAATSAATPAATATAPATAPVATAPANSQTGKTNPLLKRIQAAQERSRLAEQKEKESKLAAAAEHERQQLAAEEATLHAAEEERIAKAQSALRSVASRALEDKQKDILMQLEGKSAPPATATAGVPIMKSMDPPPPSFDSMKFPPPKMQQPGNDGMVGHGMNSRAIAQQQQPQMQAAPPSFDFVEQQLTNNAPPAPTAPSMSPSAPPVNHLEGIMPVAPPLFAPQHQPTQVSMPPPPSFAQFEQHSPPAETATNNLDDEGIFDYDLDGNPLSSEQRQVLLDEQRQLYESIMKEKAANDKAIAGANADSFDLRSASAAAHAMSGGTTTTAERNQAMDSMGRNAVGEGASALVDLAGAASANAAATAAEEAEGGERRMVKIGSNQMVALHGQDRTKKAIKEGTAILVQCVSCQNWMQVTDTATLMFCPVCQVVSPVIQQTEVMTKAEAIQLTMDRKLAEKLQAEAYDEDNAEGGEGSGEGNAPGYFANFFGGGEAAATTTSSPTASATAAAGAQSDSWWNKISSIVSYGVADEQRGELGVTRPPGASASSQYPAQRTRATSTSASINDTTTTRSPTHHEETRGLLSPVVVDGDSTNSANLPSGRVAEQKPLFSCMMDSMSNAAGAMFSTGEGDVHGMDNSSLLVTNAGRGVGDGTGDYNQLPDRE